MIKYIPITEAVQDCEKSEALIPGSFLCSIPNNLGINLCAVRGFEVETTDDNQYKSIRVDFLPTRKFTIEVETDSDRKDIEEFCLQALSCELDKLDCYYNVGTKINEE